MKQMALYYLSGTGNTYRTAVWMAEAARIAGFDVSLTPIEKAGRPLAVSGKGALIGCGMPVHGFTIPWAMIKFLFRLPRGGGRRSFVWATRAGAKYGPIPGYPPGIAGSSIFIAALILRAKGYSVHGMMSVNMPSNWMSLHSGLRADIVETILSKAKPVVEAFADRMLSGKKALVTVNTAYEFVLGSLLLPVSAGYLFIGRFGLAKLFFTNNKCTGCGLCAKHCPTASIRMIGAENPRPYWRFTCESCMRCMGYCPHNAIEASHSLAGLLYYVTAHLPVSAAIYSWIEYSTRWDPVMVSFAAFPLYIAFVFSVFYLCSMLLWILAGVPFLNPVFRYTTLTSLYRRYHEPETGLNDLS